MPYATQRNANNFTLKRAKLREEIAIYKASFNGQRTPAEGQQKAVDC